MSLAPTRSLSAMPRAPAAGIRAVLAVAAVGLAWNLFGLLRFVTTLAATPESLTGGGLTAAQAAAYLALPGWMTVVFGCGVLGGLLGAAALAWRRRIAVPALTASLLSYVALLAGDAQHGLFEVMPQQLAVLVVVLAVAGVLLATAVAAQRRGRLR